ncbi:MAG: glutaredoxin family protein [Candidatus Colwellbacteria bacterium]|nr:glutaredoxin family protein [Candidatus Colwellbacteria bacterium]
MITIKIYSTPFCGYCKMAKDFFDKNGLSYEEIDVSIDEAAAKEMVAKTNQMGVPVIEIGEDIVVGFNRPLIEELIAKAEGVK